MLGSRNALHAIQTLTRAIFSPLLIYFLKEFFSSRVYTSFNRITLWLRYSYYTAAIYFHPDLKRFLRATEPDSTWYFYWGNHMALVIPLIRNKVKNIFCRVHNSDLYKEAGTGYLPYQRQVISKVDVMLPCSENGKNYLQSNFGSIASNIRVARLGVLLQQRRIRISNDVPFKIVSCAFLFSTKRIRLIAEALEHINFPVHWTHIGTGDELKELVSYCRRYDNSNVQVDLRGYMKHGDIIPFYLAENFQLFLNVSTSEGIPVSIMEAMSVGIPAMATDVGGTAELVDNSVGVLLPSFLSPVELAKEICSFRNNSAEFIQSLSTNSISRVRELYHGKENATRLFQIFQSFQSFPAKRK